MSTESHAQSTRDDSPHRLSFVTVRDVRVPYLDWGGTGPALVFIPGFSNSAHVFDGFAPRFTDRYRVLAVTRVGFGESDQPADSGYALADRVEHIRASLDSAHIGRAVLVGHSLGGTEITAFAAAYPERTLALIFLDAAIDHVKALEWEEALGPFFQAAPRPSTFDLASPRNYQQYVSRLRGIELPLGEVLAIYLFDSTGAFRGQRSPGRVFSKIISSLAPPEFGKIRVPTLALYSEKTATEIVPWLRSDTAALPRADALIRELNVGFAVQRDQFQRAVPHAVVQTYPAHHYQFLVAVEDTERRLRSFLLQALH